MEGETVRIASLLSLTGFALLAAAPTSSTYKLESYGVGSGGTGGSSSATYSVTGISGEQANPGGSTSATYKARTGFIPTLPSHTPGAPTVTNPSNFYNKIHVVINTGNNPSDATFAIAVSPDAFSPTTNYVQSDQTVGAVLGSEDWLTYAAWGGAAGFDIVGLQPNVTYSLKVKAKHGNFTESAYSSVAAAATVSPTMTFDIDISPIDTETAPPYSVAIGTLVSGSVTTSSSKLWVDFDTNAANGGKVFASSQNAGLTSAASAFTIASVTGDLASLSTGYGAQSSSATQASGGPFTVLPPYNGTAQNIGLMDAVLRQIYGSSLPVSAGRASFVLMAKASATTPSATDYSDVLTIIASANF